MKKNLKSFSKKGGSGIVIWTRKDRQKAKRLKSVRDRQHLTQEKMAERLDISYSTYQRMESGRNNITIEHLEKLHKEFGVSSDYILFGTVNDEKHYELELEYMNDETKFLMVTRLIACLCRLDENKYKELMIKLEEDLKEIQ